MLRKSLSATRFRWQKWDQRCPFSLGRAAGTLGQFSSGSKGASKFSLPRRSMAGGGGRPLAGFGLFFAPQREEVSGESPWRRQHARASPVPATTPPFRTVVTSASENAHVGKQGGRIAVPGAPNCTKIVEGSERNKCEGIGWAEKSWAGGGAGDTVGSEGSHIRCFWTSHNAHCWKCSRFYGCQHPLKSVRIGFHCLHHPHLKQRLAERVVVECD